VNDRERGGRRGNLILWGYILLVFGGLFGGCSYLVWYVGGLSG